MKQVDLGGMSFAELRENDKYYVDKTLLIKDLLEKNRFGVYLFTRPRRFGKTTNLSMMDAFFNIEYKGNTWFDGLAISDYPEFEKYKNAFPVIHLDLGGTKSSSCEGFLDGMRRAVKVCFEPHRRLLKKDDVRADLRHLFEALEDKSATRDDLVGSIQLLSRDLMNEFGVKPIILIDEYDVAVSDAFGTESHKPMMAFLKKLMYDSIKGNPYRGMVYLTGVMRIAEESIFSGLNNVTEDSIFSESSDERFGFTGSEVEEILSYYGHPEKLDEVREWYDGYRFGNVDVYNPYSIMNYIRNGCEPDTYWVNSGGDGIVRSLLNRINNANLSTITELVTGGTARVEINQSLVYGDVYASNRSLFSLMAMTGYLYALPAGDDLYDISIPNAEVMEMVRDVAEDLRPVTDEGFMEFSQAVLDGDAERMASLLEDFLTTTSYLNLTDKAPENPYEMMVVTLLIGLCERYTIRTERETAYWRSDVILTPKVQGDVPIILELKIARNGETLDGGVDEALKQIHDMKYYKEFSGEVLLFGICFKGKEAKARSEIITV